MMTTLLRLQHPELRKWLTQALLVLPDQERLVLPEETYAATTTRTRGLPTLHLCEVRV
jgi:hypothetical protein